MTFERARLLQRASELAFEYEKENRGCAQAVLAALQDVFGVRDDIVFKSASGLSGGAGLTTLGSCGALSGGVMAIGMFFGRERSEFKDPQRKRMVAYRLAKELCIRFEQKYGSVICGEIQKTYLGKKFDLWNPEEYADFDAVAYRENRCPELVAQAAIWTAEIILDELEKTGRIDEIRSALAQT
ncbi:MAG: C-GCAxxG-C-C family protein [Methanomassiliicoccales archaeon]|jgi:C_GCAxxG_C_C family probable redox protein|nr:C-GCAxxG-C-C family protein [Methanomassiliicoccales archaeon]